MLDKVREKHLDESVCDWATKACSKKLYITVGLKK